LFVSYDNVINDRLDKRIGWATSEDDDAACRHSKQPWWGWPQTDGEGTPPSPPNNKKIKNRREE